VNQTQNNSTVMVVSFALAIAFWWWMLGTVEMALGFLALLFVHEMGHYLAAKQKGMNVSLPIFTPIGALINMRELPKNAVDEAYMAYAGPLAGSVAAFVMLVSAIVLDVPQMVYLAQIGFFLNLFNLIPLSPMDGGRICMAVTRHMWLLGIIIFVAFFYYMPSMQIMALFVFMFVMMQAMTDIQLRKALAQQKPEYFQVGMGTRIGYLVAWLGLGAVLAFCLLKTGVVIGFLVNLGL